MSDHRPTFAALADDADVTGVAVTHTTLDTGEVRTESHRGFVVVEFGAAGMTEAVPVEQLTVDWDYYAENPGHAVEAVREWVEGTEGDR